MSDFSGQFHQLFELFQALFGLYFVHPDSLITLTKSYYTS